MQFINYFFASVISFFGLAAGFLLVKTAPEEQKPLAKSFSITRKVFLFLTLAFVTFYYYGGLFYLPSLALFYALLLFAEHKMEGSPKKSILTYAVLGILFFLSSKNINLFAVTSSLIFLHGLLSAPLMYNSRQKNLLKIFLENFVFVAAANALFFLSW